MEQLSVVKYDTILHDVLLGVILDGSDTVDNDNSDAVNRINVVTAKVVVIENITST